MMAKKKRKSNLIGAYVGFAALNDEWVPLGSVSRTKEGVECWIARTYISGKKKIKIIPVSVTVTQLKKV